MILNLKLINVILLPLYTLVYVQVSIYSALLLAHLMMFGITNRISNVQILALQMLKKFQFLGFSNVIK